MTAIWAWLKAALAEIWTSVAAFIGGFITGTLRQKNKQLKKEARDARHDAAIASEPAKYGDDLIDDL
jgi:hypothetical protein